MVVVAAIAIDLVYIIHVVTHNYNLFPVFYYENI